MSSPEMIDLDLEKIDGFLKRAESVLTPDDYALLKGLVATIIMLRNAYNEKAASVKRLLKMIFGPKTEKRKKESKPETTSNPVESEGDTDTDAGENLDAPAESSDQEESGGIPAAHDEDKDSEPVPGGKPKPKPRPKNHGRNGASDYPGAEREFTPNERLNPGDPCPNDGCDGKVYKMGLPGIIIKLFGQPLVKAIITEIEKYRCNLCGDIFYPGSITASDVGGKHYDETAVSVIALSRYGFGIPFYRMGRLEECQGIPLPPSTQWDKVESGADKIYPVYDELKIVAAQGKIFHNDDTAMKILELIKQNREEEPSRKGMFTSCVISVADDHKIAIFTTGRKHAGENLGDVLEKREPEKETPIQMGDALSRNYSHNFKVILASCLVHGRRKFVEIETSFPEQCGKVIDYFGRVYKNDQIVKDKGLSDQERLEFHQQHSEPVMEEFHGWLIEQFDQKLVEPNSSLGKAIAYMLKHWEKLTLFLREPGAPLDNNICERALKMSIMHRKNSLFYKTEHGAYIGDMYMSLIHTCILNGVNPFDYLTELQRHKKQLFKAPENWMPWNYQETISELKSAD